jgi:hypothetical protein
MGTKMAPSYANIFMGKLEKLIIQYAPYKPISCLRFIDEADTKWTDSEENLNRFFDHANNVHPSLCGMLVHNDVTSIETRMVPGGSFEDNQWCLSNVRVTLLHGVEGGNRRIRRFFCGVPIC